MATNFDSTLSGLQDKVFGSSLGLIGNLVMVLVILIVVGAILGVIAFFIVRAVKYKYKVVIFEKINGRFEPARKDRACETKFGDAGDMVLKLRKHKKILPMPTLQVGRRTYWYAIREDGEWINIGIGDLDNVSKEMGVTFLDKEMRYARTQIQRGLKERLQGDSFWDKYGQMIMSISFILIIGVMTYLLFDKWIDLAGTVNSSVGLAKEVLTEASKMLQAIDSTCSGSGIVTK